MLALEGGEKLSLEEVEEGFGIPSLCPDVGGLDTTTVNSNKQ